MKLIFKFILIYLLISAITLYAASKIIYYQMEREIITEERLYIRNQYENLVNSIKQGVPIEYIRSPNISVEPLVRQVEEEQLIWRDTSVYHTWLKREEPHLKLIANVAIDKSAYHIEIFDVIVESDDIVDATEASVRYIFFILVGILVLISTGFYLLSFQPFKRILQHLQNFSIRSGKPIPEERSTTSEFRHLSRYLHHLSQRAINDYNALKEFSENTSHQFQTPIAIASGKLELLMESSNLDSREQTLISEANDALRQASRLGKSLTLMAKLDQEEYLDTQLIDAGKKIRQIAQAFQELMEIRQINFQLDIKQTCELHMNTSLFEVLMTNLLQNAIQHGIYPGTLAVEIFEKKIIFSNPGPPLRMEPEKLFQRFKKASGGSSGLGLSIVKSICDKYHFTLAYQVVNDQHALTITTSLDN